jgi:hypothetical protein
MGTVLPAGSRLRRHRAAAGRRVAGRYLVIDRWETAEAYNTFATEHRDEYMRRVDDTRFHFEQELRFGTFETVWPD